METIEIIKKIKDTRIENGVSLGHLSKVTGLSKGYLSTIENRSKIPPISTLHRIATALGVSLSYFFSPNSHDASENKLTIFRKKMLKETEPEQQVTGLKRWPLADQKFGRNMHPFIIEVPSDHHQVYQFEGEEFYMVLEGKVEFTYGGETYIFKEGDCTYFDGDIPYSGRSLNEKPAKLLMMVYHYKRGIQSPYSAGQLPYKQLTKESNS